MRREIRPPILIAVLVGVLLVLGLIAYFALRNPEPIAPAILRPKPDKPSEAEMMKLFQQDPARQSKPEEKEKANGKSHQKPNAPASKGHSHTSER